MKGMEPLDFNSILKSYLDQIEEYLKHCLAVPSELTQKSVLEAMAYSVEAGGKRIRPILTLEFCRLCGGETQKALPFAAAVEMVHSYSLIHDDLPCMDNDDFRRGKPSCHKAFGEAGALLAGDALLTMAFEQLSRAELPPERIVKAVAALSGYAGARGMIGGQVIDLENEGKPVDAKTLKEMYDLKTAALLRAACELGCIAAGASQEQLACAADYATALGFAFQIVDDILDIEGDSAILGKETGSDAANGKRTYPTVYGTEQAKRDADTYTRSALKALTVFGSTEFLDTLTEKLAVRNR